MKPRFVFLVDFVAGQFSFWGGGGAADSVAPFPARPLTGFTF